MKCPRNEGRGSDNGREALENALSVLRNSVSQCYGSRAPGKGGHQHGIDPLDRELRRRHQPSLVCLRLGIRAGEGPLADQDERPRCCRPRSSHPRGPRRLHHFIDADKPPEAPGVTNNDARFQDALIPKFANPLGVAEGDILSTVGWLHLVAAEDDGDYHIQISPTHDDDQGTDFLIVEVPTPETEFVADASLHERLEAVRSLIREGMLRGREPSTRGPSSPIPRLWKSPGNCSTTIPTWGISRVARRA